MNERRWFDKLERAGALIRVGADPRMFHIKVSRDLHSDAEFNLGELNGSDLADAVDDLLEQMNRDNLFAMYSSVLVASDYEAHGRDAHLRFRRELTLFMEGSPGTLFVNSRIKKNNILPKPQNKSRLIIMLMGAVESAEQVRSLSRIVSPYRHRDGRIVVASIVNFTGQRVAHGIKIYSLTTCERHIWNKDDCELCRLGSPVT